MKTKILFGGLLVVLLGGVILFYPPPNVATLTEPIKTPTVPPLPQSSPVSQEEVRTKDIPKQPNPPDIEIDSTFNRDSETQQSLFTPVAGEDDQQFTESSEKEIYPTNLPRPVKFVRQYLADRLGITPDSIKVIRVEHRVWLDGCLEVPAPELCAPGEVPGFRVILQALEKRYVYHTDKAEGFRFVEPSNVQKE